MHTECVRIISLRLCDIRDWEADSRRGAVVNRAFARWRDESRKFWWNAFWALQWLYKKACVGNAFWLGVRIHETRNEGSRQREQENSSLRRVPLPGSTSTLSRVVPVSRHNQSSANFALSSLLLQSPSTLDVLLFRSLFS